MDRARQAWSHEANLIGNAKAHNLGSQGTPANRGVSRPASWIYGVLLWQLPARNTLDIARVAARIFRRTPPSITACLAHCHVSRLLCSQL